MAPLVLTLSCLMGKTCHFSVSYRKAVIKCILVFSKRALKKFLLSNFTGDPGV